MGLERSHNLSMGLPGGARGKESTCQDRKPKRYGFDPWVREIPWSRKWKPTTVFLPGKSHGQRSLRVRKELEMTKQLNTHTHTHKLKSPTL